MKDTIYREDAINALENIDCSDGIGISALKCDVVEDAINAINTLPSAQPTLHGSVELKDDYKKALDCILAAYLNPEVRHNILEKFVFETFSVGEEIKKEK